MAVRAQTVGSDFDTVLDVLTGSPGSQTLLICNDDDRRTVPYPAEDNSVVTFRAKHGTTYWFLVGGYQTIDGRVGNLKFNLAKVTPPANDDFEHAQAINPGFTATVNQSTATHQKNEPTSCDSYADFNGDTVWYRYQPSSTTNVTFDPGNKFDTEVGVYTGTEFSDLVEVTCGNEAPASWTATGGTLYWIQVAGYNGSTGTLKVHFGLTPP